MQPATKKADPLAQHLDALVDAHGLGVGGAHALRDQRRAEIAASERPVPEHLKGRLFSERDLYETEMAKVDAAWAKARGAA
jgi:hypothetical protein